MKKVIVLSRVSTEGQDLTQQTDEVLREVYKGWLYRFQHHHYRGQGVGHSVIRRGETRSKQDEGIHQYQSQH